MEKAKVDLSLRVDVVIGGLIQRPNKNISAAQQRWGGREQVVLPLSPLILKLSRLPARHQAAVVGEMAMLG